MKLNQNVDLLQGITSVYRYSSNVLKFEEYICIIFSYVKSAISPRKVYIYFKIFSICEEKRRGIQNLNTYFPKISMWESSCQIWYL